MTLKTLKEVPGNAQAPYPDNWAYVPELRKEAIKWIKELKADEFNYEFRSNKKLLDYYTIGKINWIEHFFNLTKKDLEEKKGEGD